jgi:hypothetical protein
MDDDGMLAGAGVLVGVRACWDDWEGVGLTSIEGVGGGLGCLLLWAEGSGSVWQAESNKHIQIKAMKNMR